MPKGELLTEVLCDGMCMTVLEMVQKFGIRGLQLFCKGMNPSAQRGWDPLSEGDDDLGALALLQPRLENVLTCSS